MPAVVVVVVVVVVAVMVVMVTDPVVTSVALAQGELGGQLPDGLPLVQDGLLLPDQALAEVQDSGFGLVRHKAASAAATAVLAIGSRGGWNARWGEATRVGVRRDGRAHELGANAILVLCSWQTPCRCST